MKKAATLLILLAGAICIQAQDVHFSQFYETPLLRNPALAGIFTGKFRAHTVYRNQWPGVKDSYSSSSPYTTMALGIEYKLSGYCLDDNTLTGGIQIMKDYAGAGRLNRVMSLFNITYRQAITDRMQLAAGLYGGPVMSNFDFSKFSWDDQYVNGRYLPTNASAQPIPLNTKTYGDIGAGLALSGGEDGVYQWYAGGSAYHLNRPRISFINSVDAYQQKVRGTINGGLSFLVNEADYLKFYADVMFQGGQQEYVLGALYKKRIDTDTEVDDEGFNITAGILYRYNDAVIPVLNVQSGRWAIGFSYDANVSRLMSASKMRGGMEFTLKYRGLLQGQSCDKKGCFD
jgi:type IX secretion system PorP/SprF family membrane protein